MPHLRQLRCSLSAEEPQAPRHSSRKRWFNEEKEKELLDPLKQINKPDLFEVVLRWEQLPNSITKDGTFPFVILRRDENALV